MQKDVGKLKCLFGYHEFAPKKGYSILICKRCQRIGYWNGITFFSDDGESFISLRMVEAKKTCKWLRDIL